uniref:Protein roadkill n=2 Tax=Cajanus cajan TaxID=3821 RepID=A0A151TA15_CAJCA|nr:Protein roadkill [Cajanus cajan]
MQKRTVARWNGIESTHTSSRSVTETVNGSHDFLIKGFSLTKGMGVGVPLKSESFSVGGYEWGIYFYPDGSKLEDNKYVSIFVALLSDATNVRALFELAMLDQSGEDDHKINSHFDRTPDAGPHTLKFKGSMWGFRRYFKRRVLETSRFLKDDCLKIHCVVGVLVSSSMDCSNLNPIEVPESDMGAHFGMLLDDEELSDVTFVVDGEKFYAHKLILTTRSTTFETRFLEGKGLDKSEIVITDVEPRVFKTMLQFIYIDNFLPDEELLRHCSASLESVFESFVSKLLIAAEKYGLPRLKSLCEYLLCQDICVETVAYLLAFADCHDAIVLKSKCLEFSADYLDDVLQSEGCKYLKKNCPLLLSELEMMECVQNVAECKGKLTNDVPVGEEEARVEEQNQNVSLIIVDDNN